MKTHRLRRFPFRLVMVMLWPVLWTSPAWAVDPNGFAPSPGAKWFSRFCTTGREIVRVGDFNADGRHDLVAFEGEHVWVLFATVSGSDYRFDGPVDWNRYPLPPGAIPEVGDVDGDGYDDLVYFMRHSVEGDAAGDVWAIFTDRNGFNTRVKLSDWFCINDEIPAVGYVDRNNTADLMTFIPGGEGTVWVGLSAVRQPILDPRPWTTGFLGPGQIPLVGDFNGDGRGDIAAVVRDADPALRGQVFVALAQDDRFGPKTRWSDFFCIGQEIPFADDVNGDGRADLISFARGRPGAAPVADDPAGDVYTALSCPAPNGSGLFGPRVRRHPYFCVGAEVPLVGDFNNDRKADILTLVRNTVNSSSSMLGNVYVACSTFGKTANWSARLEAVKVERATESSGDDPYFIVFGFRVRANQPESAQVWRADFRAAPWEEDLAAGESVRIHEAMGTIILPGVEALTLSDLEAGRLPELVGIWILNCESDSTSWDTLAEQANTAELRMRQTLADKTVEHPIHPASRLEDLKHWAEFTMRELSLNPLGEGRFDVHIDDKDEIYGNEQFFYLTVDPEALPGLNLAPVVDFGTRTLTEQYWRLDNHPLIATCSPDGQWKLQFRLSRIDRLAP